MVNPALTMAARRSPPDGGEAENSENAALAPSCGEAYFGPMMSFDDIRADFEFLEDWDDRYKYLIDLGRNLAPYPEAARDEAHKVKGCASQVWLHAGDENGVTVLHGDSDAHIVRGLVALLIALYSGKTPDEMLAIDPGAELSSFDLDGHLTPQRSNGLHSMVKRIREIAAREKARA